MTRKSSSAPSCVGQLRRGMVLVDHRVHPVTAPSAAPTHRDPAAAAGDHDVAGVEQACASRRSPRCPRVGRRTTRRYPRPASSATCQPRSAASARPAPAEERADRLGRARERRVGRIHDHMADHGRDADAARRRRGRSRRDQRSRADPGSSRPAEQRLLGHQRRDRLVLLDRQVADLGAVAVHDRDPPARVDQPRRCDVAITAAFARSARRCRARPAAVSALPPERDDRVFWSRPTFRSSRWHPTRSSLTILS